MQTRELKQLPQARGLVVSIHDVSPRTWEITRGMMADLASQGVHRVSLLVIPNHHHKGHFLEDHGFCEWLRAQTNAGHEAVVHGYFHQRERREGESAWNRLVTESYTAGEGEFYDMDESEAFARLTRARAEFREAGLAPAGFIAPAWLLGAGAERAVARAGFQYTTRLRRVDDLARNTAHASQSLVYSVRAAWRRATSLGWNSLLLHGLGDRPLIRIGLHPPDWNFPAIRKHVRKCIALALAGRKAITYEDWLGQQRAISETNS